MTQQWQQTPQISSGRESTGRHSKTQNGIQTRTSTCAIYNVLFVTSEHLVCATYIYIYIYKKNHSYRVALTILLANSCGRHSILFSFFFLSSILFKDRNTSHTRNCEVSPTHSAIELTLNFLPAISPLAPSAKKERSTEILKTPRFKQLHVHLVDAA
jgi:hypothetical protein